MQQRVCKLLLKEVLLQVVTYALLNHWHVQQTVDCWTLAWILLETEIDDVLKCERIFVR